LNLPKPKKNLSAGKRVSLAMRENPVQTPFFVPKYIPQFDGLRGLAILLVLVGHSGFLEALPHGAMLEYTRFGVDLFFVLSGFLITGILADSKRSPHYFRNFYVRRMLRIWPLYYLVLFLAFVVAPLVLPAMRPRVSGNLLPFVFYVQNIVFAHRLTYPFGLGATWSLAVEEQFYLTWPLVVFLLKKRTLALVSASLVLVSLTLRLAFHFHGAPLGFVHFLTLSRLDSISFGSLAALWLRTPGCTLARWRTWAYQFLGLGVTGTVLARVLIHKNSSTVGYTFLAIAFTGLLGISLASDAQSSLLGRSLSGRWLRYVGKISYGIYLLHYPIFILWARLIGFLGFHQSNQVVGNLLAFAGQLFLATAAASMSWHFFEEPILRLKERFPSGSELHWPTVQESKDKWRSGWQAIHPVRLWKATTLPSAGDDSARRNCPGLGQLNSQPGSGAIVTEIKPSLAAQ
jgi:peptidoglycan/LPS O-acetylase OafA/YrhL